MAQSKVRRTLLVIMDGVGESEQIYGNAVRIAHTPTLDYLKSHSPSTKLFAHGPYVGLPTISDIGNSEVGHNAIGSGQIFDQGAKLVEQALSSGLIYKGKTWQELVAQLKQKDSTLHLIGLLSDGNVHSHQNHLHALMVQAKKEGIKKVRIHTLLDGRDVSERSAEVYLGQLDSHIRDLKGPDFDARVASGGGRMYLTMDRYEADWSMVKRGWFAHVLGIADFQVSSALEAVDVMRKAKDVGDQDLPSFVVCEAGQPIGRIDDGDAVIFFNFRGDRAIEISQAFTEPQFSKFDRQKWPQVFYAGMMEYDGDLHIPTNFLVHPPQIANTLSECLLDHNLTQFACSETQKFGHVTYFWNGNRSGYLDAGMEEYLEIPSDVISFAQRPWMKAQEITAATIERMHSKSFHFGRINFANGDMVGHTGDLQASVIAVGVVDQMLAKLIFAARQTETVLMITADHGNCEQMFEKDKGLPDDAKGYISDILAKQPKPKTSHTLNKVPFVIYDPQGGVYDFGKNDSQIGLAHIANTVLEVMGLPAENGFLPSLLNQASIK